MNYRRAIVLAEKTLNESGTETIDINVKKPISRIDIMFRVTKGGNTMASQAAFDVSKIELVDGSNVLHSLSGLVNQGLCIYDRRVPTMNHGQHMGGNSEVSIFGLDFGRSLWDPLLALEPSRFSNPQLKFTYSRILVDTAGSACYMTVIAHIFDEKVVSPMGFLMSKEVVSQLNPANDAYKYIDLPTDFPIRKMILRAEEDGYEPWSCIEGLRLDEDNEARIPFDSDMEEFYRINKHNMPRVIEPFLGPGLVAGRTFYVTPTCYMSNVICMPTDALEDSSIGLTCKGGKATIYSAGDSTNMGIAQGYLPNHCFEFPFGIQDDPEDWYDVSKVGNLRARVRGGAAGAAGTHQLALQQLRRY